MRLITPQEYIDDLYDGIDFPIDRNKFELISKLMTDYAKYYHRQQVKSVDLADVGGNEVSVCKHEWEKLDWDSNVRIDCECGESFYRFTN
jgi:hypothetical protein